MPINIQQTLLAGFVASLVWFIVGGVLYMNPFVAKIYGSFKRHDGLKRWKSEKKYLISMYLYGSLIQCIIFAFVYAFLKPVLAGATTTYTMIIFGSILIGMHIFPRLADMWLRSTYPEKLLAIEFINGAIGSFVIALTISFFL